MNTHKVLSEAGYAGREDYGLIAREAAMLTKSREISEQELRAEIERAFGPRAL